MIVVDVREIDKHHNASIGLGVSDERRESKQFSNEYMK